MKISVVIPSRNSEKTLERTLLALKNGKLTPDEIIIVDGCSTDHSVKIAREYGCRVIINNKKHVAAARQLGTVNALYDVVVFTDSDCRPAYDWLFKIALHFSEDESLEGVGGSVFLSKPFNKVQSYCAHVFETIMQFPEIKFYIDRKQLRGALAGANCGYKKEAILSIGGFRESFTNHAEEIDLCWRLVEKKSKLLYDPDIKVEHLGYPHTVKSMILTNINYGFASTKLAKHHIGMQINLSLYKTMIISLLSACNPFSNDQWAFLRFVQLASFIFSKWVSSLIIQTINI